MTHEVEWRTASPLWPTSLDQQGVILRPAILRFTSDRFMDDLIALLQSSQPGLLRQHVPADNAPKLFQPVHGEFNLVAASLVCRTIGLPDRAINPATDKIGFVLRRYSGTSQINGDEYAWVVPSDPQRAPTWQKVQKLRALAQGEELIPLFPLSFINRDRKRRIFAGLIPTASRDNFLATETLDPLPADNTFHPLEDEINGRIVAQLKELKATKGKTPSNTAIETSLFLLLDLAIFLETHLPSVWNEIAQERAPTGVLNAVMLQKVQGQTTLYSALKAVHDEQGRITGELSAPPTVQFNLSETVIDPDQLGSVLKQAIINANVNHYIPPSDGSAAIPKFAQSGNVQYVLRCIYHRDCKPVAQTSVSEHSVPFTLASFFDPDAPARTIRIAMPVDTTPGGLRKFKKNVGFLLSDHLRKQLERVTDAKKALDGDMGDEPSLQLGAICSFSLPIITICALIVLMIFLNLLNIIFWWLPLLRICIPINLKAKETS